MSARELILLPKQKYDLLMDKTTPQMTSVETQTEVEESKDIKSTEKMNEVNSARPVQAIRTSSWETIPGIRLSSENKKTKRRVKWIPY